MIKFENIKVHNIEDAFRGLRNPMNSWAKSDSYVDAITGQLIVGPKDLELAQRMIRSGTDESKFLRQIFISVDITTDLAMWKEIDTYKVATVANSCSTMHKIDSQEISIDMFSTDGVDLSLPLFPPEAEDATDIGWLWQDVVFYCEQLRKQYKATGKKDYWRTLIKILPEGWLHKRTYTFNYQTARAIYFARNNHKQIEWHDFCDMLEDLPYGKELISYSPPAPTKDFGALKAIIKAFCFFHKISYEGLFERLKEDGNDRNL